MLVHMCVIDEEWVFCDKQEPDMVFSHDYNRVTCKDCLDVAIAECNHEIRNQQRIMNLYLNAKMGLR